MEGFPLGFEQRSWILTFLERFLNRLEREEGLRSELFLAYKDLPHVLIQTFLDYRRKHSILLGLGRHPGENIAPFFSEDELRAVQRGESTANVADWVPEYQYWFVAKDRAGQFERFFGFGRMTLLMLPPDPATKAPPLPFTPALRAAHPALHRSDIDAQQNAIYALNDAFLAQSKEIFGKGLEEDSRYPGISFVLPMLHSGNFFDTAPESLAVWFSLFDLYVAESPADKGVLLAFAKPYADHMLDVLDDMRAEGLTYKEGWR